MSKIIKFFNDEFNMDLSDTKVFFIALDTESCYDTDTDTIYINSNSNQIVRELSLVFEYANAVVRLSNLTEDIRIANNICKDILSSYIEYTFGNDGLSMLRDFI